MWSDPHFMTAERIAVIQQLLQEGKYIGDDGKIHHSKSRGLSFDIPWVFVGEPVPPYCSWWNHVYFQKFHLIPNYCRTKCHKVVCKPRTLKELYTLADLQDYIFHKFGFSGKCGIDVRPYTFGPYAGFWYNPSMDAGLRCYETVRSIIDEHISPDVPVILKKGCTEMENPAIGGKPSDQWGEPTPEETELEDRLNHMFFMEDGDRAPQPQWLKERIKAKWIENAYRIGDPTVFEFVDKTYGVNSITYHNLLNVSKDSEPAGTTSATKKKEKKK